MKTAFQIRFLRQLKKLAQQADRADILLPNGAEVGSLLGSMADDLQLAWKVPEACLQPQKKDAMQ